MEHIRNKKARKSLIYKLLEVFGKRVWLLFDVHLPERKEQWQHNTNLKQTAA
jgi:hypothetical protein